MSKENILKRFLQTATIVGTAFLFSTGVYAKSLAVINAEVVNVRQTASASSEKKGTLTANTKVEVLGIEAKEDGNWFKIQHNGEEAYITSQFAAVTETVANVADDGVNLREAATTDSSVVARLTANEAVKVKGVSGDFYEVEYNGQNGYVHVDFLKGEYLGYVNKLSSTKKFTSSSSASAASTNYTYVQASPKEGINVRSSASTSASVVTTMAYEEAADLIEQGSEWHKIKINGVEGYVSAEFTSLHSGKKPDRSLRSQVVSYAKQFMGTRYSWGGTNLKSGVDCSGFTYAVYRDFGYKLNRSSRDQIKNGTRVKQSELIAGDLVFFDTNGGNNGSISHVGLYIGGGQFIHASSSSSKYCVTISSLSEAYYSSRYVGATRIIQ